MDTINMTPALIGGIVGAAVAILYALYRKRKK